ncbi:DNA-binding transcriptional regulator LsrR (DeoR family) [Paenibacillus forsythiae]|uniref:DNA-binding transcriptional regulator LsrR (DeoR family) n=1 Tax=Paenibacillus forsythiae TaxID=365616 RepID=A0ABU3H8B9_9BACL|nr:sugar-binding transcriptional regulator [Paenibacillus forsythiae]MDT3426706.1 DNA-binding transcriptional regulator LsrR (DeoR family) [Paenibacillus forsythiae]
MDNNEEIRLMLKVAQMYYDNDMTQSEISKELGIYRTTISRMLKKIRERGIVKITINYSLSETFNIERQLVERFGLKEAIVVPVAGEDSKAKLKVMGQACAQLMSRIVQDEDVVGLAWGSSLAEVIHELEEPRESGAVFVPLVGGPSGKLESQYHVNTLVYAASQKFKGTSSLIDVPAILERKETRDQIVESQYFQNISDLWDRVTVAIFGIGSIQMKGSATWNSFYGNELFEELERGQIVGDICSQFFDIDGNLVNTSISERTIAIGLDHLKKTRYAIGVAESPEKADAIIGALRGKYLNVLVTTEETARIILERTV